MVFTIVFMALSICFCFLTFKSNSAAPSRKTIKITDALSRMLLVLPLLALIVFAVLFSTVLKGRFLERSSHALIVFMLWVHATSFYILVLKYFKNKLFLGAGLAGFFGSAACAVSVTPLDRYCTFIYSSLHEFSFLTGGFMLVLWYFSILKSAKTR